MRRDEDGAYVTITLIPDTYSAAGSVILSAGAVAGWEDRGIAFIAATTQA